MLSSTWKGLGARASGKWQSATFLSGEGSPTGEPLGMALGSAAVRLSPEGEAEVVWGRRLDPARIEVLSIPLPSSGRRWGEVRLALETWQNQSGGAFTVHGFELIS